MCRPATCPQCGKATYAGCGQHIEQVLGNVPPEKRCSCDAAGGGRAGGFLRRILGG
ncbi:MAG: hypothetical protein ACK5PP_17835 [Acidimicrobiales bacterium]